MENAMQSKRAIKVKKREERKKKNGNTVKSVATPHTDMGRKIQNGFDKSLMDEKVQEFQKLLGQCKVMITELYNRTVKIEVAIAKLITLFTKNSIFSKSGVSKLEAISRLNIEKNKIYVFKKNIIGKLVLDYVKATRCKDQMEAMFMLQQLGEDYNSATFDMQELFEAVSELNTSLELEETSEGSDDGVLDAPEVTEVEEIVPLIGEDVPVEDVVIEK